MNSTTKKTLINLLSLSILATLALPAIAFAQPTVTIGSITGLVSVVERFMWIIFGGIAVIMFVVAGILFLTAQGDPEKVQAARSAFIWGIAGVVVAIIAYSIIAIVTSALSGAGS